MIAFANGAVNQPEFEGIEVLGSSTGCAAVPSAPTGLTATASSSSAIGLGWTAVTPPANCSISSYTVYGGTTANPTTVIASGLTGTTYSNTGLAASTTYYYVVKAVDADGASAASAQAQATTPAPSCSTVPSAPTGLTATASSSSAIGLGWTAVTPPANCSISSYTVYGGTTANPTTVIAKRADGHNLLQHRPRSFDDLLLRCQGGRHGRRIGGLCAGNRDHASTVIRHVHRIHQCRRSGGKQLGRRRQFFCRG